MIIGTSSPHENLHILSLDEGLELLQRSDDPLEGGGHISEVGNAAPDDEHLAEGVSLPRYQGQQGLGVVVGLLLRGGSRVLPIVG